ncbi:MAG TPA: aminotransferase class V-fold PLP-dependent enzyme [Acidimicrobiia bacterium]
MDPQRLRALDVAHEHARAYLAGLAERPVGRVPDLQALRRSLGGPLPEHPTEDTVVVDDLADAAEPGLVASAGPRYFGFVVGGALPAALAADWLVSAWDQNAGLSILSPAAAVVEEVTGDWLRELFGLAPSVSVGFVTGGQMANLVGLSAARHHVLARAGWDVEASGLAGAPPVRVVVGEQRHATIDRALRFLGLGTASVTVVPADDQGRLRTDLLPEALAGHRRPTIVCAQAGDVNSGAFDDLGRVCDAAHDVDAWVHVDGAIGLWAAVSPQHRHLVEGLDRADSWATDAHKWLNVPYDSGIVFSAHADAHSSAFSLRAPYLVHAAEGEAREASDWVPESSRRARAIPVYAALRSLGRSGVAAMVERCCALARRFADALRAVPGIEVCNDVVLNQVLVRFEGGDGEPAAGDDRTRGVIAAIQDSGVCWMGGTMWQGRALMRISVSNWSTTEADVDRSVDAIRHAVR